MKLKFTFLFPLLLVLAGGCMSNKSTPAPITPEGNFSGQFVTLHLHSKTGVIDTQMCNLQINMETTTGYKVTGDTSTLHAGSYGTYSVNSNNYILFTDKTYPLTGTPSKIHLSGIYSYSYDGTNLQIIYTAPFDTLTYQYILKK